MTDLKKLLDEVRAMATRVVAQVEWADSEVLAAQARHPEQADLLFHAFPLLEATAELMRTEFVYRGHARELLERVAAGGDTREATDAELAIVMSTASQHAPISTAGVTVYMRVWQRAFPDTPAFEARDLDSYEHVAGDSADELEADVRRRLRRPDRALGAITCAGTHHGQPRPDCPYAVGNPTNPPSGKDRP